MPFLTRFVLGLLALRLPEPRPTLFPKSLLLNWSPILLCLAAISLAPASAQGNYSTNGPYALTFAPANSFTATDVPVTYNPQNGSTTKGYLTLSGGTVYPGSPYYYTGVHMAFSPTLGGTPTVTDTFDCTVYPYGSGLYSIASVGATSAGNDCNLAGGSLPPSCTTATLSSLSVTPTFGTVTLSGPVLAGGEVVSLSSSSPLVTVPSSVLVPYQASGTQAGSATFTISPLAAPSSVVIKASYHNVSLTATLTVTGNAQVPKGGSVTFAVKGSDLPGNINNGIDIIDSSGSRVASCTSLTSSANGTVLTGSSNGWTFSANGSGTSLGAYTPSSFTVQAPADSTDAPVATGYEIRASLYEQQGYSAPFDVVRSTDPASSGLLGATGKGMTLTSDGIAQGFALTTFVYNLPSTGTVGPLGSVMTPDGNVLVEDDKTGAAYTFKNIDNQDFLHAPSPVLTSVTPAQSAFVNYQGTLYAPGYELNPDGSVKRLIATLPNNGLDVNGVDVNPRTGHLIVSANPLLDIDPQTGAVTDLFNVDPGPDGLVVSPDGSTVYVANDYEGQGQYVYGYDLGATDPTKMGAQVFNVAITEPDGLALGAGTLNGYLFVNTNQGNVYEVNLATRQKTLIASNGSRGDYIGYSDDGSLFLSQSDRVLRLIPPPGASFGAQKSQSIYTRDDLTHANSYPALSLSSSQTTADSVTASVQKPAAFDTVDIDGLVTAARMQRAGRVNYNGQQFDLQLGVRSLLTTALTDFAPIAESAQNLPSPDDYLPSWSLSAGFLSDIQTQLGDDYLVSLTDQISSLCGLNTVVDTPHQNWPFAKDILTFSVLGAHNPQIPQGRSLDILAADPFPPGQNPAAPATWDISYQNSVIASSGNPAGWNVEDDHTAFGGVTVTVPTSAAVAAWYTVRFFGQAKGTGRFDVVPDGSLDTAAILQPLVLSKPVVVGNSAAAGQVTATVTLDAPAPAGGATVTLTSSSPAVASVPSYVVIPEGQTMATFTVSTSAVSAPNPVSIQASYNGYRIAALAVVDPNGVPPSAPTPLTASGGDAQVTLSWNAVSGATGYTVYRSTVKGGPYAVLFAALAAPGYVDAPLANGTTYYYVVSATNAYGESLGRSNEASATPQGPQVAMPTFSTPTSGSVSLPVEISDATPGAFIHYTLDGTTPTEASPLYGTPLTLDRTTTVQARAYKPGDPASVVASQIFTITPANQYAVTESFCGGSLSDTVATTDPHSPETGYPAKFYKYQGVAGETVTITATSTAFSPVVILHNPQGYQVAPPSGQPSAQLTYMFPDNGLYAIEVTSTAANQTGNQTGFFTLSVNCGVALSGFTLSPTVVTGGAPVTAAVTISQPAPGDGVQVALSSNASGRGNRGPAPVPVSVFVPAGQTQATFTVHTNPVTAGVTATLTATLGGVSIPRTLTINPPGTPPVVAITSPSSTASLTAPGPFSVTATATASGAGVSVSHVEIFADGTNLGSLTASPYTVSWNGVGPGTYSLTARATDSRGLVATSAPVAVTVSPIGTVAKPTISPNGSPPNSPFSSSQTVTLADDTPGAIIYYTVDGTEPTTSSTLYTVTGPGPGTGPFPLIRQTLVKAKAFLNNYTPSATASALFQFNSGSSSYPPPTVSISAPADGSSLPDLTPGVAIGPTPVTGTVTIATGSIAAWQLSYRMVNKGLDTNGNLIDTPSDWVPFAAGTTSASGTLGTFDTTLLLNGLYEIQLMAEDSSGRVAAATVQVVVRGNQKVGYFTFAYTDLTLPAAGLPIQVTRSYDSRDKTPGDFGVGWKLGLTNVRLQKDGALGEGWMSGSQSNGGFYNYYEAPTRSHVVTITFPTGECYQFDATLFPSVQFGEPLTATGTSVVFEPRQGTKGSLRIVGDNEVGVDTDGTLLDLDGENSGGPYDRTEFLLTTKDGRQFDIDQFQGLLSITDRNQNRLTFNHNGTSATVTSITSTSMDANGNPVPGRGVSFLRPGPDNYITQIQDLNHNTLQYVQTGGDLTSFTDRSQNLTTYTYDGSHNVTSIKDALNHLPLRNEYDAAGRLLDTLDAHGHKIIYTYNASSGYDPMGARQETVTDRLGNPTLIGYDAYGNVTRKTQYLTDYQGNTLRTITTSSVFGDARNPDKPTQTTDALGNQTDFQYDGDGNLTQATQYLLDEDGDLLPVVTKTTYNAFGQPLTVTDAEGKTITTNVYNDDGTLQYTRDALGHETDFAYNKNGTLQSTTDALGHVTSYTYYPSNPSDVWTVTDAHQHQTTFTYDADGNKKSQVTMRTTAAGQQTLTTGFAYDSSDRLQTTTYPDTTTTQTQYNEIGKVGYTRDAQGRQTTYTYDDFGQLTLTTYPDNTTTGTTYDAGGQALTRTDRAGRITGSVYDSLGRVVASGAMDASGNFLTDAGGNPIFAGTSYDDAGQVISQSDERGDVTLLAYDTLGRKTSETDALHHVTQYEYDLDGRQVSVLDANGHQTTYDYDDAGRLTVTHYHDGSTSQTKYDALGRRTDQTDQYPHTTHYDYDELGRLWKVTDPMTHVTTFGYDELGEKTSQTDANNHTTLFAYDNRGRLIQKTLPMGQSEVMDYTSPGGQLWHKYVVDQNGGTAHTTTYAYDPTTSRLSSKSDTDEDGLSDAISYQYNTDGSRSQVQRVRGTSTVTTTYGYYPSGSFQQGQLQTVTTTNGALTLGPITYTYDAAGNKLTAQTPSGTTSYGYDMDNRLSQVTHKDGAVTLLTYDAAGNRATLVRQAPGSPLVSSITTTYGYDTLNRLTSLVNTQGGTTLSSYGYTLYPDGKRHVLTDALAGTTTTYSYFDAGWLKEENGPQGDFQYAYDNVGNRQTKSLAGTGTQTYVYDNNDRLSSESGYLGSVTYGYDAGGNMTGVGAQTYAYDFENRLLSVTQGGSTVSANVYDGDGNRIGKADNTGAVNYLVDASLPFASVVEERDNSNTLLARYDYEDDLVRMDRAGGVYYYLYDGLGSTRQLVNASGTVTDGYGYDAFGIPSHTRGSALNPFQFNGQQYDGALGLYFLRARYYAPTEGRFLSQDPFRGGDEDPITLHRYLYASDDPTNNVDPAGNSDFSLSGLSTALYVNATVTYRTEAATLTIGGLVLAAFIFPNQFDQLLDSLPPNLDDGALKEASSAARTARQAAKDIRYQAFQDAVQLLEDNADDFASPLDRAFSNLSDIRKTLSLPAAGASDDVSTLAKLEINGQEFYGINGHGQPIKDLFSVNAQTATHAEGDVFRQAKNAGIDGGDAILYVDRALCDSCGLYGGVKGLGRQLHLTSLTIYGPNGSSQLITDFNKK